MIPANLHRLLESEDAPLLIDVRTSAEFETAHIPGSHNVPLDLLRKHAADLGAHLGGPAVLVCRSGRRATEASEVLAGAGVSRPALLEGGIAAWQAAGAPMVTGPPRWDLERQVRLVAGSIVLGSVLLSVVAEPVKWVAAAIGGGLAFAALSNTCAMGMLLARLPYNRGPRRTIATVLRELASETP